MKIISTLTSRSLDSLGRGSLPMLCALHLAVGLLICWAGGAHSEIVSDSPDYLNQANSLLQGLGFDPGGRLPLYPSILAAGMWVFGGVGPWLVVVQSVSLFISAWMAGRIGDHFCPGSGLAVLSLSAFNPLALFYVQVATPENLFSLLYVGSLYFLLRAYANLSWRHAVAAGMLVGASALTRANGLYVAWAIPVCMGGAYWMRNRSLVLRPFALGVASLLCAMLVIAPWAAYQKETKGQYQLTSSDYKDLAYFENLMILEMMATGTSGKQAGASLLAKAQEKERFENGDALGGREPGVNALVGRHVLELLADYPMSLLLKAMAKAEAVLFFSNGVSSWVDFLGTGEQTVGRATPELGLGWVDMLMVVVLQNVPTTLLYAVVWGFIIVIRLLNVVGLWRAIAVRNWEFLFVFGLNVLLFAFVTAFAGYSRYRLPIDFLLFILAVMGLKAITHRRERHQC